MTEAQAISLSLPYPWHESLWDSFNQTIEQGRLAHALMLNGPQGIGKERLAMALAQRLLCHCRDEQIRLRHMQELSANDGRQSSRSKHSRARGRGQKDSDRAGAQAVHAAEQNSPAGRLESGDNYARRIDEYQRLQRAAKKS